jgi:hypothetical protein
MYVFLVIDPTTTAGSGIPASNGMVVDSTKSGPGSFHLFAVDDVTGSFGIKSYQVKINGTLTSFVNRSPFGLWNDAGSNGPFAEGFNDVRVASTATGLTSAGQGPTNNPQIRGVGISASDFFQKTSGAASFSSVTNSQWGNYNDGAPTSGNAINIGGNGAFRNAVLLAEGTYSGALPIIDTTTQNGTLFNYYLTSSNVTGAMAPTLSTVNPFVPEPATLTLLGLATLGISGSVARRRG